MKKTVLGILLLCTLLLIRPATALASGPSCDFCGRDVTFVKLKTYSHYHEFIYWCDSCKMNTRRAASHTGGTATCTERAVCEVCKEPYGELAAHTGGKATCTERAVCEVCNQSYGELAAHTGGTATCTERAVCEVCNQPYGEPPAHTGGTEFPTCTTGRTCKKCGAEYGILGHMWTTRMSLGNGTHRRSCMRCGAVDTANCTGGTRTCFQRAVCSYCRSEYGDLAPHQLKTFKRPATCQQEGLEYTRCTAEGCNYRTPDIITPKQHVLKKAREFTREPTCTKPGWKSYYLCTTCTTYSETDWVEKLGHDWDRWTPIYDGTHTHTRRCKRCNAEETGSCSGGYADCTSLGMCETCGGSYYGGHDLVHHDAKAATCTGIGWNAYDTCSRCDYTTTYQELPALNHDLEQHKAKAPTCTEKGWNAYETCSRCDYTTYVELPAQHDLEQHAAKAPTCTEKGWDAYDTCKNCDYTTYTELPALNHDYQAVTVAPTCEADGYTVFTCSRCNDSYTADPTDKLGHQFGAWSPNGTGSQSADCLRQGCAHTGSTDCRKFTFRTAEGETLTFCPVCGQAENAAQLEMIDAATAWPLIGSLSAEDVTARTNGEYLSVAFETAGSLTQPTGRVRLALPAGLLEGKTLVRIAPDGTQTEMPFETKRGKIILTLDFVNSELPVMLFRLVPQTAAL